jgi:alpha-1,3-rhamnosyl/mannosyltransferase
VYHEPNFIPFPSDLLTVATIHDLSILQSPEWHPADRLAYFDKHFQRGLAQCAHFIAISEFGRRELVTKLGISPERISRTYMGIRPDLTPLPRCRVEPILRRLGLPAQYLLYVGTIEPRKNLLMLLRAYCSLPARLRTAWPLVLVGGWGWNAQDVADFYHNEAQARGVIYRGYVPDKYLGALYNGARALVFPSHYEGFGLPPLEMMACGGAVLASTAGALVETMGDQAHLIGASDVDGWQRSMERVLTDDDWCQALREGATTVARPYTWEQCAADTIRAYRRVCGQANDDAQPGAARLAG